MKQKYNKTTHLCAIKLNIIWCPPDTNIGKTSERRNTKWEKYGSLKFFLSVSSKDSRKSVVFVFLACPQVSPMWLSLYFVYKDINYNTFLIVQGNRGSYSKKIKFLNVQPSGSENFLTGSGSAFSWSLTQPLNRLCKHDCRSGS